MAQIKSYVLGKSGDHSQKLKEILDKDTVGLLVSERMMNVPHDIVLPVYRALFANMEAFVEEEKSKEKTKSERPSFQFDHYLIVTGFQQHQRKAQHKDKKVKHDDDDEIDYYKVEDGYFRKFASIEQSFPLSESKRWTLGGNMSQFGLIMLLGQKELECAIQEMERDLED